MAGQPNCGKSTIFNAVAGFKVNTGNFSGTTVSFTETRVYLGGRTVRLIDLPGTYSLLARSPDEQVTTDTLAGRLGDGVDPALLGTPTSALLDGGGYAEYAVAPASQLLPVTDPADMPRAAALPEALATAWFNLVQIAHLRAGQSVLIQGGSGGVGHVAIKLARLVGADVLTTVGAPWKGERCRDLGADVVIDYHDDVPTAVLAATGGRGVDVILDVLGAGALADNLRMLAPHGQLAIIGLQQGRRAEIDLGQLLSRRVTVHGSTLRARTRAEKAAILAAAAAYAPYIEPAVHAVVPLRRAGEAHALMDEPGTFGKVVLQVR